MKRWKYQGDMSLAYGGYFFDFSEWKHGYVPCVEVIDLDSAVGFTGAVHIEHKTVLIDRPKKQLAQALDVVGASFLPNGDIDDNGRTIKKNTSSYRVILAYACCAYGHYDQDDGSETLQLERDGPMQFDGWHAEKRLRANASLENYVRRHHLR